ncbi:hypothetical protein ACH5RR_016083 [Cinchona calisaya]|uniref:Uncharacterized protein n=1 Tax=Cinchona calisaya TaxID=153742 RepID=A0ABD2ZVW1_9GENT
MVDHIEEESANGGKPMVDDKMKQRSSGRKGKEKECSSQQFSMVHPMSNAVFVTWLSLSLIAAFLNLVALVVIALRQQTLLSELDAKVDEWNALANVVEQDKESGWKRDLRLVLLILTMSS